MPRMPKTRDYTDGIKRITVPIDHDISISDIIYMLGYAQYMDITEINDIMNCVGTRAAQKKRILDMIKYILKNYGRAAFVAYDEPNELLDDAWYENRRIELERAKRVAVFLFPELVTQSAEGNF